MAGILESFLFTKKILREQCGVILASTLALGAALFVAGCAGGGAPQASGGAGPNPTPSPTPAPSPAPTPGAASLTATPGSINFGAVALNTSVSQTVKITNTGTATVNISQDSLTGSGLSTGLTTPLSLNSGQSVNAQITFSPSAAGIVNGSMTLSSNGQTALTVPIQGNGVAPLAHRVDITWNASISSGVQGYNVYRSGVSGGPYSKITPTLAATALSFGDGSPVSGKTYFYIVTAVDGSGVESLASKEVNVTVPTP
jgi:hypothetical protein